MQTLTKTREAELGYKKQQDEMEINKAKKLSAIEMEKFENMVKAIGPDTIKAIANAGPQMQVCHSPLLYPIKITSGALESFFIDMSLTIILILHAKFISLYILVCKLHGRPLQNNKYMVYFHFMLEQLSNTLTKHIINFSPFK